MSVMTAQKWSRDTDDVLCAHRPNGSNCLAHKPASEGSLLSACSSMSSEGAYRRYGLWYARRENCSPCRSCFPNGWAS